MNVNIFKIVNKNSDIIIIMITSLLYFACIRLQRAVLSNVRCKQSCA